MKKEMKKAEAVAKNIETEMKKKDKDVEAEAKAEAALHTSQEKEQQFERKEAETEARAEEEAKAKAGGKVFEPRPKTPPRLPSVTTQVAQGDRVSRIIKIDDVTDCKLEHTTGLMRLKVGTFMQLGADLGFVSAFPDENEVLYPPLTYLESVSPPAEVRVGEVTFTIVDVEPFIG